MQICAAAGLAGSGKTTLCRTIADCIIDGGYGLPVFLQFSDHNSVESLTEMAKSLHAIQAAEFEALEEPGNMRAERIVLIDNLTTEVERRLLKKWDAMTIFIDSSRRNPTVQVRPFEDLLVLYANGMLEDTLFDWAITNYHDEQQFIDEITISYPHWIGGTIWETI